MRAPRRRRSLNSDPAHRALAARCSSWRGCTQHACTSRGRTGGGRNGSGHSNATGKPQSIGAAPELGRSYRSCRYSLAACMRLCERRRARVVYVRACAQEGRERQRGCPSRRRDAATCSLRAATPCPAQLGVAAAARAGRKRMAYAATVQVAVAAGVELLLKSETGTTAGRTVRKGWASAGRGVVGIQKAWKRSGRDDDDSCPSGRMLRGRR
jgi:hypothetical protein